MALAARYHAFVMSLHQKDLVLPHRYVHHRLNAAGDAGDASDAGVGAGLNILAGEDRLLRIGGAT